MSCANAAGAVEGVLLWLMRSSAASSYTIYSWAFSVVVDLLKVCLDRRPQFLNHLCRGLQASAFAKQRAYCCEFFLVLPGLRVMRRISLSMHICCIYFPEVQFLWDMCQRILLALLWTESAWRCTLAIIEYNCLLITPKFRRVNQIFMIEKLHIYGRSSRYPMILGWPVVDMLWTPLSLRLLLPPIMLFPPWCIATFTDFFNHVKLSVERMWFWLHFFSIYNFIYESF